jgi:hypothetical protein
MSTVGYTPVKGGFSKLVPKYIGVGEKSIPTGLPGKGLNFENGSKSRICQRFKTAVWVI